jgi:hypothetical protein
MVEQTTKIIAHANQYLTPSQWMPFFNQIPTPGLIQSQQSTFSRLIKRR